MKNILIFLLAFLFVSCVKITKSEPITQQFKILEKHHSDSKTEYTYHYGYSMMRGKWCYHYGPETTPEKNIVIVDFLGDMLEYDNASFMNKDYLKITYVDVFHDGVYHHKKIKNVE